jgi:hypothetical protein
MRCPVGALHLDGAGGVRVVPPDPDTTTRANDEADFLGSRGERRAVVEWPDETWGVISMNLSNAAAGLKQDSFYPLVAHLFTAAGHPAWRPNRGDTSNRIDLILTHDDDSLPVEVKSPTESNVVNVKSVQQALENRVVLDERAFFAANPNSSTLVVGFDYPPDRSDVAELINDIYRAFDVNVGLVSLPVLYDLALRCQLAGVEAPRVLLSELRGPLQ